MKSKELIRRIIRHDAPERIGYCFLGDNPSDIMMVPGVKLLYSYDKKYSEWGREEYLTRQVPDFSGEVRMSPEGNIFGRFEGKTSGECIKGALQDSWDLIQTYTFPELDIEGYKTRIATYDCANSDRYLLSHLPFAVFSPLRDMRHMENALMDILIEPENVCALLDKTTDIAVASIPYIAATGANGAIIYDDLGMQHAPFLSPAAFREILKPYYKKLADALHSHGMDFFVHSCGKITDFIPDFIDAGVDVFQFDQPELHGVEALASKFGDKATFFCPVDIQKIMPTGDRKVIENGTLKMVNAFKKCGGGLIVKDYFSWNDINVLPEWQQWARDVVIKNAYIK